MSKKRFFIVITQKGPFMAKKTNFLKWSQQNVLLWSKNRYLRKVSNVHIEISAKNDFLQSDLKTRYFSWNVDIFGNIARNRSSKWSQNNVLYFEILIVLVIWTKKRYLKNASKVDMKTWQKTILYSDHRKTSIYGQQKNFHRDLKITLHFSKWWYLRW